MRANANADKKFSLGEFRPDRLLKTCQVLDYQTIYSKYLQTAFYHTIHKTNVFKSYDVFALQKLIK
jgi:hypothetical protein